jgi:hypothetical protein
VSPRPLATVTVEERAEGSFVILRTNGDASDAAALMRARSQKWRRADVSSAIIATCRLRKGDCVLCKLSGISRLDSLVSGISAYVARASILLMC